MDLIITVLLAMLGLIGAVCSRLVADEFKAWNPWLLERLLKRAVNRLENDIKVRCEEEWRSHLNEIPGDIGKLIAALGFQVAARRIAEIKRATPREAATVIDKSVAAALLGKH